MARAAVRWPDGTVTTRYRFTHDLYRDVAESRIAPNRKMSLHRAIGTAIENGHGDEIGDRCGELARHFLAASDPARAIAYLRRTGEQAADRYDPETESALLARIAEHPLSACNSWASLAAWCLGDTDASMALAETALEAGRRRLYALSTAQVQLAFLHQLRLEPEKCLHWATLGGELAEAQGFPFRAVQAELLAGWARAALGEHERGIARLEQAMERYEASTARIGLPYALALQADAQLLAGHPERALAHCDSAIETLATTTRSFFHEPELHRLRALAHHALGHDEEERSAWQEAERAAERLASPALRLRVALDRHRHAGPDDERARQRALIAALVERYRGQGEFPDLAAARRLERMR